MAPAESPAVPRRRSFARRMESLPEIFEFLEEWFQAEGIDRRPLLEMQLGVEELFTNMVRHASGGAAEVTIQLCRRGGNVEIEMTDYDVDRFDPRETPDLPEDLPLELRRGGGLGIHLTKRFADRIDYDYRDRRSRTVLLKRLE